MSCEIIAATDGRAVLNDTSTGWAFGPVFPSPEDAQAFLRWLGSDPRDLMLHAILAGRDPDTALESAYLRWLADSHQTEGRRL
jgi:hypothetical protein